MLPVTRAGSDGAWARGALASAVGVVSLFAGCTSIPGAVPTAVLVQPSMNMIVPGQISPPPVRGFAGGQTIWFAHTEASDAQVADTLTKMMGHQVLVVPELASLPRSAVGDVFVFTNGVKGDGPLGFQPDVFDRTPGETGYTPLRELSQATWRQGVTARELRSADEVRAAEASGEVTITRSGVVANMPLLTWPGGRR